MSRLYTKRRNGLGHTFFFDAGIYERPGWRYGSAVVMRPQVGSRGGSMSRKSTQIALGGMFSALCLVLMFMTGMVPFSTYAIPALAGFMLIPVMEENGRQTAFLVYITVSVLSVFIVPDREAAMLFIAFFGYYPITKPALDGLRSRPLRLLGKGLLFNAAIVLAYLAVIHVFGMAEVISDMGDLGKYSSLILLGLGNIVFWLYDYSVGGYTKMYINWFKPRFLRR